MKVPIVGGSYEHISQDANYQRCINMFPMLSGPEGRGDDAKVKEKRILIPTAGLELLIDLGDAELRCLQTHGDYVYAVVGNSVRKITVNHLTKTAVSTTLGTISTSTGKVYMASNPTQIVWVDGSNTGYIYTPGSGVFATINSTDSDFPGGSQVVFIDSYFVVNDPGLGTFYSSASNNGNSWDPLDVATAENGTDEILGFGVSKGDLWVFGNNTTEIWYNAANPSGSPFSPRQGLGLQIGCGAAASVVEVDDLLIWLDNRGYIVQSNVSPFTRDNNSGYQLEIISTEALTTEILSYRINSDAIAMSYNDRGHLMYQITFPTAKKTWVYDYTTKIWHERAYYNEFLNELEHHLGQFYTQYETMHLMGGIRNGKIYISDSSIYTDNTVGIRRIRTTSPQYDEEENRLVSVDRIQLRMETGNATQTGLGSDPQIELRYSLDGGHTWSHHMSRSFGRVGQYSLPIQWNRLGYGREWVLEFSITEPIPFSISDATIKYEELED